MGIKVDLNLFLSKKNNLFPKKCRVRVNKAGREIYCRARL